LQLALGCIVESRQDHVRVLHDLPYGTTLAQKIVASLVFSVTEILIIEYHKFHNTFLHVAFGSQSLLKSTSDQTRSDTNCRTGEGRQMGVNVSQSKFFKGT
jgi:hypothetical protein